MRNVFISYSHKDEALWKKLETHLALLRRQGRINIFHDRNIPPGGEIDHYINHALNLADIILLLVSADFLASDYCYKETQIAMKRHAQGTACVIPVILRPCDWKAAQFGGLEAVPTDGKPVVEHEPPSIHDKGFLEVARAVRQAVESPASPSAQQEEKSDDHIGRWRSIAEQVESVDREFGARAWFSVGYLYGEKGDYEAAIDAYTKVLHLTPNDAAAYTNRGNAKNKLGDHEAAIADHTAALRLDPNLAGAYTNRGVAKNKLGDHEAAIADYSVALRLDPNLAGAYTNRGVAKNKLGDHEAAIADYSVALRLDPNLAGAYTNRGNAKNKLGDHEAAIADYSVALRLDPNDAETYTSRGNAKNKLGDHEAAIADYSVALRLDPNLAAAYYNRGAANDLLGRVNEARRDFEKALALAREAGDEDTAAKMERGLADLSKRNNP